MSVRRDGSRLISITQGGYVEDMKSKGRGGYRLDRIQPRNVRIDERRYAAQSGTRIVHAPSILSAGVMRMFITLLR